MKVSSLFIFVTTVLSSVSILDASEFDSNNASEAQINLADLVNKESENLNVWLLEKKTEIESVTKSGSSESLLSPDATTNSTFSSESESPAVSDISTPTFSPYSKEDTSEPTLQEQLNSLDEAIIAKDTKLISQILNRVPDWKMTTRGSNRSVLSIFCKKSKSKFLGRLSHPRAMELFAPLLEGKHKNMAGGYLAALSLFRPKIQLQVMSRLIEVAPYLRGILLQTSIYYRLDESVIKMILNSGALINFENHIDQNPLRGIPSLRQKSSSPQFSVNQRFFMNFIDPFNMNFGFNHFTSPDNEVNFLLGMMENCVPDEVGVLRVAFEYYKPEIVLALVDLCPAPSMTSYHLAHLIAKNGPTPSMSAYPSINSLVDSSIVYNRLVSGEADLVALAFMSQLPSEDQNRMIDEFLAKTRIFSTRSLHNPCTMVSSTSQEFENRTGIYELPSSPADVFLLTACKWNIDDLAFAKIFYACKKIANRQFWIGKSAAFKWAEKNGLAEKMKLLA